MSVFLFLVFIGLLITYPLFLMLSYWFGKRHKDWATFEKQFVAGLISLTLTPIIIYMVLYIASFKESYVPDKQFSQELWMNAIDVRHTMINDLIEDKTLIGLSVGEIKEILGEPVSVSDTFMTYFAGSRSAGFGLNFYYLKIKLDQDKAIKVTQKEMKD